MQIPNSLNHRERIEDALAMAVFVLPLAPNFKTWAWAINEFGILTADLLLPLALESS